MKKVNITFHTV